MHLDHVTIRTNAIELTRDFMITVFDLVEGERPATIIASVEGYWLYEKEWPLIHIIKSTPSSAGSNGAEAIDHFAFVRNDYENFKQKLRKLNISFKESPIPELQRKRIFLHTPSGVLIETIFEEAHREKA